MSGASTLADVLTIFLHCAMLSVLAVGGGITLLPDFHRFLVAEKLWMTDAQFTSAIALAQSAPGPNILFVSLLGWNAGFNGGGYLYAFLCGMAAIAGILIPSTTLTLAITRWAHRNQEMRVLRAFKQGMAPMVVALLFATVWLLVVFYLLFYSSYGPLLWRLLRGPLGILLAIPAAFALLFWLARLALADDGGDGGGGGGGDDNDDE